MCFFAFVFLLHKLHSSKTSNHLPGSQIFLPEVARRRLAEHFVVDLYKPFMPSPIQAATCFYPRRTLLFGSLKGSTLNPKEPGRDSRWKSLCSCSLSDYTGVSFFFFGDHFHQKATAVRFAREDRLRLPMAGFSHPRMYVMFGLLNFLSHVSTLGMYRKRWEWVKMRQLYPFIRKTFVTGLRYIAFTVAV